MFYSQFILAKKGPLGTIWIAAHLERKLRKNQVADTDIGVSVDSILFPEAPIALRLSSHLLLGVVRIYSRKVNYLFNDCSETLVKIKQAFHSTAVDLPPEASTAPYHSITLPETFDLDDLELPESSFSHGNFVDHHVTTREQITLQDPVEDTVYLGSQFGLDERFGDGDALQIGLDFDEDLFAEQMSSPGPSSAATHLVEDVLPTVLGAEGRSSIKMEIKGQQSHMPAVDYSHLDEDRTRDLSTMQTLADNSGKQNEIDFPNTLPPSVVDVESASSKEVHTPDLNREIFHSSTLQGPSTPRLIDETLTAQAEEILNSSALQTFHKHNSVEGIVPAATSQMVVPASCSVSGLPTRLEQAEKTMLSQDYRSMPTTFQFEERKEADTKNLSKEQVQPVKEYLKEQWLLPQNESILSEAPQPSMTFHGCEDVNLFPSSSSVQAVTMETSKEVPTTTVASNSESMASLSCSLAMPTVPPSSVHYELDVSKQQLLVHEIQAPTSSLHSTNTVFRAHDVSNSTSVFQQLKEVGDGKKQLHLASGSQGLVQISPMHEDQMLNTSVQQSPTAMQTFSTCLSGQQFNSSSGLQSVIGISGTQQMANHEPPAPGNVFPYMQEVSPIEFQQPNKFGESKQQFYLASGSHGLVQFSPMHEKQMPNASVQQSAVSMQTFSPCFSGQQFNPASGLQSAVAISGTQQLANYEPRASANVVPYMQEISPVELQQLNNTVESKQQQQSSARSQEYAQVTNAHSSGMDIHQHSMAMHTSPICLSGQQFNLNSGNHSAVGISDTQDLSIHTLPAQATTIQNPQDVVTVKSSQHLDQVAGNKQQLCLEAAIQGHAQSKQRENFMIKSTAQEFNQPMRASTPSGEYLNKSSGYQSAVSMSGSQHIPTLGNTSGPAYVASQEFWSPQRFHVPETSIEVSNIVSTPTPSLHGAQHVASKTGESVSIFPSSDMQRIATNVPVENTYPRSSGFSIPAAVQGVSKGTLDGSILQGISFPLQAPTLGTHANVPSRNIVQPCSFSSHAGTHGVYTNVPSQNMLLQDNYFSKATESGGFPPNVTASQKSAPATFQHHVFSNPSDELSNALSISHAQDLTASKGDQFETMQPRLETIRRSEPEIPAHEILRSSYNVGRNGVDIFGLKQPMTEKETPRELEKFTISSKQSVGRKRHMIDTTPVLREATPKSRSKLSLSARSMDYIPHDDDVLASILGRTPSFKIKPTPAKTVSAKRRKPTPRRTGLKRKALIDIAMVIHGDVIRQQLANTEDIRRVRKKAPCTPQEIRMIQKESQAHDIFFEPSIPGLCMELRDPYSQVFGLTETKLPQVGKNDIFMETQKEKEPTGSLEPINDFRIVQLEQVERPLGMASEIESSVHSHVNEVHMDYFYGSRMHKGDGHGKQEHDRPLDMVSGITSSNLHMNNVRDKQEQEKPYEMGNAVESTRANIYKQQEHERLQKSVSEVESIRGHVYDVRQSREHEPQKMVGEVESSQIHTGDGHIQKEQGRPWRLVSDIESERGLSDIESNRVLTVAFHEKDQGKPQGVVSETKSSGAHMLAHPWKQGQEQERPEESVLETESSRVYAYGVQGKKVSIEAVPENSNNVIIGSEVSNVEKTLESSVVPKSHAFSNQVFVPQNNTFGVCQVPDLQGMQASINVLPENSNNVITGSEVSNVRKTVESFPHEIFVTGNNTFGVSQMPGPQGKQVSIEALPENPNHIVIGSEVSNAKKTVESSAVLQGPVNSNNIIIGSEVSNVRNTLEFSGVPQGHAFAHEIFVTQDNTFGVRQVPPPQGRQVSIEALPENPSHIVIGSEVSNVKKTLESSPVPQGHVFVNEVFMSQNNTSGVCQVPGPQEKQAAVEALPENPTNVIISSQVSNVVPQVRAFSNEVFVPQNNTFGVRQVPGLQDSSALEGGFHNIREFHMASHQFPLKSSCFSENSAMSLEVERGPDVPTEKHGGAVQDIEVSQCLAENRIVNEREKIHPEDPELAMMKKHGSDCLVENQVVYAEEGADMEPASEVNKIELESEQRNKEPNFSQDRKEQSQEIAVVENSPIIGTIEETVKDFGSQRQTVWHSAFIPVQGTDSVPNNNVHNGDLGYLNMSGKASLHNFEAENAKQYEQVLLYAKSTEMSSNQAEVRGDATLGDREAQDGLNRVDHTATEDDEEFDFLGDADDTEFMQGDVNAQDEFDGKSKAPDTEENQIQENSGWSARTRAVSRYLKLAFESMDYDSKKSEAENRQNLSLDHLLVGKKRKEAARMFFETLVLKTRDYVNVDQKDSYDDIRIHPRAKLMNTNF